MSRSRSTPLGREWLRTFLGHQKVAFLLVGAANLVIGLTWFTFFHLVLGDDVNYMVTLVLAYAAAILCAFALYRKFVFKVRGGVLTDLARFTLVQMASFLINAAALPLFVSVLGMPVLLGQLASVCVVVVFNYFGHGMFSFRRASDSPGTPL